SPIPATPPCPVTCPAFPPVPPSFIVPARAPLPASPPAPPRPAAGRVPAPERSHVPPSHCGRTGSRSSETHATATSAASPPNSARVADTIPLHPARFAPSTTRAGDFLVPRSRTSDLRRSWADGFGLATGEALWSLRARSLRRSDAFRGFRRTRRRLFR